MNFPFSFSFSAGKYTVTGRSFTAERMHGLSSAASLETRTREGLAKFRPPRMCIATRLTNSTYHLSSVKSNTHNKLLPPAAHIRRPPVNDHSPGAHPTINVQCTPSQGRCSLNIPFSRSSVFISQSYQMGVKRRCAFLAVRWDATLLERYQKMVCDLDY